MQSVCHESSLLIIYRIMHLDILMDHFGVAIAMLLPWEVRRWVDQKLLLVLLDPGVASLARFHIFDALKKHRSCRSCRAIGWLALLADS
mmetsp:Transcript_13585/g.17203  ORF Transcript_13585/g.17203 Transcript_13585/m.17203 type:complete len:89 (+) Transcript_13585:329-595(+)